MNTLSLSQGLRVEYPDQWQGKAVLHWVEADGARSVEMPADTLLALMTGIAGDGAIDTPQLAADLLQVRRDFELLRRQAEVYKREVEGALSAVLLRLSTLEAVCPPSPSAD